MTMPIIVGIVLALLVMVVLIYIFMDKGKMFSSGTSCEESECALSTEDCSAGMVKGFTPCTKVDAESKKHTGRCCVKEDPEA